MDAGKNKTPGWRRILMIAACVVFAGALAGLAAIYLPRLFAGPMVSVSSYVSTDSSQPPMENPIDFAALQAENPDTVAWIKVTGTVIDYPVMQSTGDRPENFYLNHASDGTKHRAGSIYIQKMNAADFSDPNTLIYGHNMASGKMFAMLHHFKKQDFFEENRKIIIYTPGHILTYEIYSAFVYDNRHILNSFNFFDEEEYGNFLSQTLNPASMTKRVREGVNVTTNARIVTLSTCTGNNAQRYLVVGVLTDDQPTR